MYFESVLDEVGDFGRYQKNLILTFMAPTTFASALCILNVIFMVATPDHWCHVPELSRYNLTEEQRKSVSIPKLPDGSYSKCLSYQANYTSLINDFRATHVLPKPSREWPTQKCIDGWEYRHDLYQETIATKWNLVCDKDHMPSLILTLANAGSAVGTFLFAAVADRLGRKSAFLANISVAAVSGVLSIFSPTFAVFAILRTLTGSTVPSNFQMPYIITVEQVGPRHRTKVMCLSWIFWTLGTCSLALVAYLSHHWATLGLVTTLPITVFYAYKSYLTQSPRFLLAQGRCEEAGDVIEKIAVSNRKKKPQDLLTRLEKISESVKNEEQQRSGHSVLDLFRYPQLRKKLIVVTLNWTAISIAYIGLLLNVSNLSGNDFLNFFLLSAVELPAYPLALLLMERLGRRWSNTIFVLLTGTACLVPPFVAEGMGHLAVIASMIGKFGSAAAFMVIYQQASELYPTPVRAVGMGTGSTVSSLAVITVPYICYLGMYNHAIPFLMFGALCLSAGLLAPLLPETLNRRLPQTIEDSEKFRPSLFCCFFNRKPEGKDDVQANSVECADVVH